MTEIIMIYDLTEQIDNYARHKRVAEFIRNCAEENHPPITSGDFADELRTKGKYHAACLYHLEKAGKKSIRKH